MEKRIIHIRIRDLRRERELTQEELAEALGISRQSINAMEAGRCLPSLPVAIEIASFFEVPLNQLIAMAGQHQRMLAELDQMMLESGQLAAPIGPAVNITEDDQVIEVELMLPGFKKDDIELEIGHDFLTVSGEAKEETDHSQLVRREFTPTSFSRTIQLPSAVQADEVTAQMKHGILMVRLQKQLEHKKTKRIEISAD